MKCQMALMWLAHFLENEQVCLTNRETRCRNVLLERSMSLVNLVSFLTAQYRCLGKTALSASQWSVKSRRIVDTPLASIARGLKQSLWNEHQRDSP